MKLIEAETAKEMLKRVIFGADRRIDAWVDAMPGVDAIPVEWLKGKENCEDDLFGMCKSVLFMWNRETKTLNKGKAGIWEPLGHIIGFLNHPDSEYYKCSLCGYEQYTLYQQPPDTCPACFASMTSGKGDEQ